MSNNKHMNAHDRIIIENGLDAHDSFKTVAKKLNKDCTTISKEVKKILLNVILAVLGEISTIVFIVIAASLVVFVMNV